MTTQPITDQERDEARCIMATDNDGAGLDVHGRSYFAMVADWPADAVPVRSETGGILGYTLQSVTAEIERLMDEERGYLDLADAATEPELAGAYRAIAQNYRLARQTRETDQAYTAQTFKLDAAGWENLMPQNLAAVYMGKSQGMWPRQRAQKDAAEAELAAERLLSQAQKNAAERKHREELTARAAAMPLDELNAAVTAAKDLATSSADFLILVRERDARSKRAGQVKTKAARTPASDAPWTEVEEHLLAATAPQTAAMNLGKLQGYRDAYAPTNLAGRTRLDQLHHEAIVRELAQREQVAADALVELEQRVPKFTAHGFGPHYDFTMERSDAHRVYRMTPDELKAEKDAVMALAHAVTDDAGKSLPRDLRSNLYHYASVLREQIAKARKEAKAAQQN